MVTDIIQKVSKVKSNQSWKTQDPSVLWKVNLTPRLLMNCQGHEAGCVDSSGVGDGDQLLPRHRLCGMLLIKMALLPRTLKIEPF